MDFSAEFIKQGLGYFISTILAGVIVAREKYRIEENDKKEAKYDAREKETEAKFQLLNDKLVAVLEKTVDKYTVAMDGVSDSIDANTQATKDIANFIKK